LSPPHADLTWGIGRGHETALIIRGGYNFYPREVENVLQALPAVAQAAVVGVAHARYGEEVKAVVVLTPGAAASSEDIAAWCGNRLAT